MGATGSNRGGDMKCISTFIRKSWRKKTTSNIWGFDGRI